SIPEQFSEVESGERILRRGAIVTPRHVAQLKVMAEAINRQMSLADRWLYVFGISLSTVFIIVLSAVYLRSYQPRIFLSTSRLILICSVALVSIALSKLFILLNVVSPFLRYPLFISFAALIISMVFGTRPGMVSAVVLSIFHGICYGNSLSFALTGMAGALGAAIWGRKVRRRADMIRVGAYVGLTNFAAIICLGILDAVKWPEIVYQGMGGIAFGGLSTLLAAAVLPAIEYVFNIITNPSLVELSDSDHPLLKRMVMEIPGTYHHSLVVGNLAESASEAVGANPLLARVGSYFHDIGKLKKHGYFSENEEFGKSKHDTLIPSMSALIIISHVKEGIDLAREYKLNRAIIDIIKEHHGTSIVYYFYKRAKELNNGPVHEKDFRYPGPKPQMRE
ncbi:MAG: HDIG domain-containing protein, partial [Thermoplasmata archaeon]|nr:HDIG domain-containing protein [Thermoplasmata archaeon]